jgi:CDP-diacylglycerol--glycerol-3-phosphate 3-phosphatidyltransferase
VLVGLTSIGLSGLGIPYVLPVGMWALAAGTAFTLYQRMRAVYVDAKAKAAQPAAGPSATAEAAAEQSTPAQSAAAEPTAAPPARARPASAQSEEA